MYFDFVVAVFRCIGIISKSYIIAVDDRTSLSRTTTHYGRFISIHFQKDFQKVSHSIIVWDARNHIHYNSEENLSSLFQKKVE